MYMKRIYVCIHVCAFFAFALTIAMLLASDLRHQIIKGPVHPKLEKHTVYSSLLLVVHSMQIVLSINQKKISAVKIEVNGICLKKKKTFYQGNSPYEICSQWGLWIIQGKVATVSGERCYCWPWNLPFQCSEHQKQNSIHIHCIWVVAEIPERDTLKCRRIKQKLDR